MFFLHFPLLLTIYSCLLLKYFGINYFLMGVMMNVLSAFAVVTH
jgi:hypothetical protein